MLDLCRACAKLSRRGLRGHYYHASCLSVGPRRQAERARASESDGGLRGHYSHASCRSVCWTSAESWAAAQPRPKRPLKSLRDFVCSRPTGQTAGPIAMKLYRLELLVVRMWRACLKSRFDFRKKNKLQKKKFWATVPTLGAIFSRFKTDIKKVAREIFLNIISFRKSPFAARYLKKWRRR